MHNTKKSKKGLTRKEKGDKINKLSQRAKAEAVYGGRKKIKKRS